MALFTKESAAAGQMQKRKKITDANLLLIITIAIFLIMYIGAMIFLGGGFLNAQNLFNILMQQSALILSRRRGCACLHELCGEP